MVATWAIHVTKSLYCVRVSVELRYTLWNMSPLSMSHTLVCFSYIQPLLISPDLILSLFCSVVSIESLWLNPHLNVSLQYQKNVEAWNGDHDETFKLRRHVRSWYLRLSRLVACFSLLLVPQHATPQSTLFFLFVASVLLTCSCACVRAYNFLPISTNQWVIWTIS